MTDKVKFYYCVGSNSILASMAQASDYDYVEPGPGNSAVLAGLNGQTRKVNGGPTQDAFPHLLDPSIFEVITVFYPGAFLGMGDSIDTGIKNVTNLVKQQPVGQKWAVGGYSQGAAVMSGVMLQTKSGGTLQSFASTFLGGVMFGNPRRANNYRGSIGGTWSGDIFVPGSTTGGHGSFPDTGPYRRLTAAECDPLKWIEFAYPGDMINSVGDSPIGLSWTAANNVFLGTADPLQWATYLAASPLIALAVAEVFLNRANPIPLRDAFGNTFTWLAGNGHVAYPFMPPIDLPNGPTCYQLALKWLTDKANESAVAPIIVPPTTTAGWSTTLVPPAA